MPTNAIQLNKKFDKHPRLFFLHPPEDDFLQLESGEVFDRIIANPPFAKNQDIEHINKMYRILKPGGIIVTLASNHWKTSTNARETEFRTWIEYINAEITDLPAGTFKESGTEIATCMLKIKKPPLRMIR